MLTTAHHTHEITFIYRTERELQSKTSFSPKSSPGPAPDVTAPLCIQIKDRERLHGGRKTYMNNPRQKLWALYWSVSHVNAAVPPG